MTGFDVYGIARTREDFLDEVTAKFDREERRRNRPWYEKAIVGTEHVANGIGDQVLNITQGIGEFVGLKDSDTPRLDMIGVGSSINSLLLGSDEAAKREEQYRLSKEGVIEHSGTIYRGTMATGRFATETLAFMHPALVSGRIMQAGGLTGRAIGVTLSKPFAKWATGRAVQAGLTAEQAARVYRSGRVMEYLVKHGGGKLGDRIVSRMGRAGVTLPGMTAAAGGFALEGMFAAQDGHRTEAATHALAMAWAFPIIQKGAATLQNWLASPSMTKAQKEAIKAAQDWFEAPKAGMGMPHWAAKAIASVPENAAFMTMDNQSWDLAARALDGDLEAGMEFTASLIGGAMGLAVLKHGVPIDKANAWRQIVPHDNRLGIRSEAWFMRTGDEPRVRPEMDDATGGLFRAGWDLPRHQDPNADTVRLELPGTQGVIDLSAREGGVSVRPDHATYEAVTGRKVERVPELVGPQAEAFLEGAILRGLSSRTLSAGVHSVMGYRERSPGDGVWLSPNGTEISTVDLAGNRWTQQVGSKQWVKVGRVRWPETDRPEMATPHAEDWANLVTELGHADIPPLALENMVTSVLAATRGSDAVAGRVQGFMQAVDPHGDWTRLLTPENVGILAAEMSSVAAGSQTSQGAMERLFGPGGPFGQDAAAGRLAEMAGRTAPVQEPQGPPEGLQAARESGRQVQEGEAQRGQQADAQRQQAEAEQVQAQAEQVQAQETEAMRQRRVSGQDPRPAPTPVEPQPREGLEAARGAAQAAAKRNELFDHFRSPEYQEMRQQAAEKAPESESQEFPRSEADKRKTLDEMAGSEDWHKASKRRQSLAADEYIAAAQQLGVPLKAAEVARIFGLHPDTVRSKLQRKLYDRGQESGQVDLEPAIKAGKRAGGEAKELFGIGMRMGSRFGRGAADHLRSLKGTGVEMGNKVERIAQYEQRLKGEMHTKIERLTDGVDEKVVTEATKIGHGRLKPEEASREAVELAEKLREVYDIALRDFQALPRSARIVNGKLVEPEGSGRWYPLSPNAEGRHYLRELAKGRGPEVTKQAEKLAERRGISVDEAEKLILRDARTFAEAKVVGDSAYLTQERTIELPDHLIEWNPRRSVASHAARVGRFLGAAKEYGIATSETNKGLIVGVEADLQRLREEAIERGESPEMTVDPIEGWAKRAFGRTQAETAWERLGQHVSGAETVARLGFSPLSIARNVIQPIYTNAFQGGTFESHAKWAGRMISPALRKEWRELTKLADEWGLTETRMAYEDTNILTKQMMRPYAAGERHNRVMELAIRKVQLEKAIQKAMQSGKMEHVQKLLTKFGDKPESTPTDAEIIKSIRDGQPTAELLFQAAWRANTDNQFMMTLASEPMWFNGSPWMRWAFKFKPFMVKQTQFVYRAAVKETMQGNFRPLMGLIVGSAISQAIYEEMQDAFTGGRYTTLDKFMAGDADMGDVVQFFALGGAFGFLNDLSYGLESMILGPAANTVANLAEGAVGLARGEFIDTVQDVAGKQVTALRFLEGVGAAYLFDKQADKVRAQAFLHEHRENPGYVLQDVLFGPGRFEKGPYAMRTKQAGAAIRMGWASGAQTEIESVLRDYMTDEELQGDELKEKIQNSLFAALRASSPLGPVKVDDREAFAEKYGAEVLEVQDRYEEQMDEVVLAAANAVGAPVPTSLHTRRLNRSLAEPIKMVMEGNDDEAHTIVNELSYDLAPHYMDYVDVLSGLDERRAALLATWPEEDRRQWFATRLWRRVRNAHRRHMLQERSERRDAARKD